MIVFQKYQTYSEPTIRHSGVNIYWQEQLERSLTTGRLNEISQWENYQMEDFMYISIHLETTFYQLLLENGPTNERKIDLPKTTKYCTRCAHFPMNASFIMS
ncbi:conserved hypothetical protein [Trichinella spiralis]|uniref:hypothetical protein n=1 Tax=Trichinella spiralis TaxID=6334 RepID=UPI0001EFDF19|nr:conserved hypothetical protein [Trichinella spiralis]